MSDAATVDEKPKTPFQAALIALGATDKERAAVLDVSRNTVLAWRKDGIVPSRRLGNLRRVPGLLDAYLASVIDIAA